MHVVIYFYCKLLLLLPAKCRVLLVQLFFYLHFWVWMEKRRCHCLRLQTAFLYHVMYSTLSRLLFCVWHHEADMFIPVWHLCLYEGFHVYMLHLSVTNIPP